MTVPQAPASTSELTYAYHPSADPKDEAASVAVSFRCIHQADPDSRPEPSGSDDPADLAAEARELTAWERDEWRYIGVRAEATVTIKRDRCSVSYALISGGLWGVEDHSDDAYLVEVYLEEVEGLKADLAAITAGVIHYVEPDTKQRPLCR